MVTAILACTFSIAFIYGCHFVDTRSSDIAAIAAGSNVDMRFSTIADCFIGYGHYVSIYSYHYIGMQFFGIAGWFVGICNCRFSGHCHYLSIFSLFGWFADISCYISIFSFFCHYNGVCSCRYISIYSFGIAASFYIGMRVCSFIGGVFCYTVFYYTSFNFKFYYANSIIQILLCKFYYTSSIV